MALTGAAMAPQKRAFGMGVFLSVFFLLTGPAPALAGWLYDRTADPFVPILLAIAMFGLALVSLRRLPPGPARDALTCNVARRWGIVSDKRGAPWPKP